MVKGSTCAIGGSQYDNAISFLNTHRGHIALITISIGGNDVVPCISRPDAATCFVNGLSKIKTNISTIVAGLRTATGPHVPIVGMNVYDPILGDWLANGSGRSLAAAAVAGVGLLDKTMGQAYRTEASPVADVQGAFHSADLRHFVRSRWGRVPVAVENACSLLDIVCHQGSFIGYGDDPNDAGAVVIANTFEKAIGRLAPPKSDGQTH
jgi:hypothetical protein